MPDPSELQRSGQEAESSGGPFDGMVVIVTGAARGLGRDYVRYLAQDGASIVLVDRNDVGTAAREAEGLGADTLSFSMDVSSLADVEHMVDATLAQFGQIDVLINNAGIWRGLEEPGLINCPRDVWDSALTINVTGTLLCYQAVAKAMRQQGGGRIINVSSMTADVCSNIYGLSKAMVERMTIGMAREVGQFGITVNCIAPGICAFEGARAALPQFEALIDRNAIRRPGTARDLYGAVRYLCSADADWVTGETIRVDGGALTR